MKPRAYFALTKPSTVALLLFTAVAMMFTAYLVKDTDPGTVVWVLAVLSIYLTASGTNALTCYIDKDVDRVMERTQKRPLPRHEIPDIQAAYFGLALVIAGLALALPVGLLFVFIGVLGVIDTVIVYSAGLKRRTPWNIILGGFSGGLPALGGWVAITGSIELLPFVAFCLVVTWIPGHIWSLAILYESDYSRAGIPMLPVVTSTSKSLRCIASTVLIMVTMSLTLVLVDGLGFVYTVLAILLGIPALFLGFLLASRPTKENARLLFKFSSPYLFLLFLFIVIDALL